MAKKDAYYFPHDANALTDQKIIKLRLNMVMEGYGLTETSPVISVNQEKGGGWKIGSVGRVIKNVTVKIAEDGEILCKGPNVMKGYYKDPEKTAEVIKDGFFQ
jgi:long-chain acyl-CoA synthetase